MGIPSVLGTFQRTAPPLRGIFQSPHHSMAVDRGLALHKMIRLLVLGLGGERSAAMWPWHPGNLGSIWGAFSTTVGEEINHD
jgi:hypothetical protein